ncbi:MAG: acetyl-CoA carboxylase carboxyl transferase subunit beta [Clostridia bacterium]|nr:acetyl-CoA carboxylase carboxyl transferase subunit beta [Clostridia bacterium]
MDTMVIKHKTLADYLADGTIVKCEKCKAEIKTSELAAADFICPVCNKYNRMPARVRIERLADKNSFKELFGDIVSDDPIGFPDYHEKYWSAVLASGENEGVICGEGKFGGITACIFVMESKFMMGSIGTAVGERITRLFEYATKSRLPVIGYTVSGGARMQEGILSLMQMEKTSAAAKKHGDAGLLYISVITDPTTGGVTASFAMLGDIVISEPQALIGFAGKRVIEQVTREKLPDNFQSAEFQLKNGFLDDIVPREQHREYIIRMLEMHKGGKRYG